MKYIGIGLIWLGYAGAVASVAFSANNNDALIAIGLVGGLGATVSTIAVSLSN